MKTKPNQPKAAGALPMTPKKKDKKPDWSKVPQESEDDLLPCPRCGSKPVITAHPNRFQPRIRCVGTLGPNLPCGMGAPTASVWNMRDRFWKSDQDRLRLNDKAPAKVWVKSRPSGQMSVTTKIARGVYLMASRYIREDLFMSVVRKAVRLEAALRDIIQDPSDAKSLAQKALDGPSSIRVLPLTQEELAEALLDLYSGPLEYHQDAAGKILELFGEPVLGDVRDADD